MTGARDAVIERAATLVIHQHERYRVRAVSHCVGEHADPQVVEAVQGGELGDEPPVGRLGMSPGPVTPTTARSAKEKVTGASGLT